MTADVATTGHLAFEGALTIRNAEAVCATLRDNLAQHASVSIDCSAVTEVDLSFIQLLIASRASARLSNRTVSLPARPTGPLLDTLMRGGFRVTTEDQTGEAMTFWFDGALA